MIEVKADDLRKLLAEVDNNATICIMAANGTPRNIAEVRLESIRKLDMSSKVSTSRQDHKLVIQLENVSGGLKSLPE